VEEVVAKGGEHQQEAALVQVPHRVQLMKTPVRVKTRLITSVPKGGMVMRRRHAGDDQPIAGGPMAQKPEPESLERSGGEEQEKILQDGKKIFNKETLLSTEDKEETKEELTWNTNPRKYLQQWNRKFCLEEVLCFRQKREKGFHCGHLNICERVGVQVVRDGMACPPLMVAQAGEVKVEPAPGLAVSLVEPVVRTR